MKIAVSRCLLGDAVRYDGGHQRHKGVLRLLNQDYEILPLCPEVAIGLGVPRAPIHLTGPLHQTRLQVVESARDITNLMQEFAQRFAEDEDPDGIILKSRSPSCGMRRVKVLHGDQYVRRGQGIFAATVEICNPLIPLCQETDLNSQRGRRRFMQKVTLYHEFKSVIRSANRMALNRFYLRYRDWLDPQQIRYFRPAVKYCRQQCHKIATQLLFTLYQILDSL